MPSCTRSPRLFTSTLTMRLLGCLTLLLVLLPAARPVAAAPGDTRLAFWITNGQVNTTAASNNTLYIGGTFSYVGPYTSASAALDTTSGAPDLAFPTVSLNGNVSATASDGAGGWFIGGTFTTVGGVARTNLAHIKADKTLDTAWTANTNGVINALLLNGTTLYVGGSFTTIGGQTRNRIAALDAATGTPSAWNPNATTGQVNALALNGTTLYVGGNFTNIGGSARNRLAALDTTVNTNNATTWDPSPNSDVYALVAATNGLLFVGGNFTTIAGGTTRNRLALFANDTLTIWDPNMNSAVRTIALGDAVYVGGSFTTAGGTARNRLAAFDFQTMAGALTTWNPGANADVSALAVSGATIYAGGSFTSIGPVTAIPRARIAAIDTAGALTAWDPGASNNVNTLTVSGNTVYVGGTFISTGGFTRNNIAALDTTTGQALAAWNPNANAQVNTLAVNGSTLYAGGSFTTIGGQTRNRLAALDATVGTATSWNPNANSTVNTLAIGGSGNVYAGGSFTTFTQNGPPVVTVTRNHIAELDATTGVPTAWDPNATTNGQVSALAVSGATVYAGGSFVTIGGLARKYVAAINASTGVPTAWDPSASAAVNTLATNGTSVYVGGSFTTIGGQTRANLAEISSSGTATSWIPGANGAVNTLALSGTTLYTGGNFSSIGGGTRNRLAALDTTLTLNSATTWDPNANAQVNTLALNNGSVYVGGNFTMVGPVGSSTQATQPRPNLAAIEQLPVAPIITSGTPPAAVANSAYTFTFTASGYPAASWSVTGGSLPPGLTLNPNGTLAGTPTQIGNFSFTVTASNGTSPDAIKNVSVQIAQTASSVTLASSGASTYGGAVTFTATVTAGSATPTGSVSFVADGAAIGNCTNVALNNGQAVCVTSALGAGARNIAATYSGDTQSASGTSNTVMQTVAPAPLTVTANDAIRKNNQPNPAFTVRYGAFANGENASALGGTLAVTTDATADSPLGTYAIVPSGLTSTNYAITFANGTLTVTDKDIPVITWPTPAAITYGTPLGATQLNATATVNGQTVAGAFAYTPAAGTVLPAGASRILNVQFTPTNTAAYIAVPASTTITVTKAPLTVTANNVIRTVGQANPALTVTYAGFVNGENASALGGTLTLTTTATIDSALGTYPIVPSGLTSTNYDITFVNGTLTVTDQPILTPRVYLTLLQR